jgi:hypothetical protein
MTCYDKHLCFVIRNPQELLTHKLLDFAWLQIHQILTVDCPSLQEEAIFYQIFFSASITSIHGAHLKVLRGFRPPVGNLWKII